MTQLTVEQDSAQAPAVWRDFERCYRAVATRDARFDGRFITAVRTTGIYCRPSCPAVTPRSHNVRFFPTSAAAQTAGFRACRRCLPDAVPGSPEWNLRADLAARAMRLIADGVIERDGVAGLADQLGYSARQLNRVLTAELGAGPLALARAHRAHAARLLIELSELPLADVAFAAGFASVRQFNQTIREVFATTPTALRSGTRANAVRCDPVEGGHGNAALHITLRLPLRVPFDAAGLLRFLAARAVDGVEDVEDTTAGRYRRTLRLPHGSGLADLHLATGFVHCTLRLSEVADLSSAVTRVRRLLDLDADPAGIDATLGADPALAASVRATPGIRLPGAVDTHEMVLRAMLGQQVSVAAARTATSMLAATLGEPAGVNGHGPATLFPSASAVAEHGHGVLRGPAKRVNAIISVAEALASGTLDVHVGRDPSELRAELLAQQGIGPWTADYLLMRTLGDPDVLLTDDVAQRAGAAALGLPTGRAELSRYAQRWRPWRSYAGMHLWRAAATRSTRSTS